MSTPYETLGVAPTASLDEIKKAYRRLARKLHPDLNPGDKAAEARFKDVASAYRLLNDPETRKRYDAGEIDEAGTERPQRQYYRDFAETGQAHSYASGAGYADFFDADDPFAELLRRSSGARANRRGQDLHYRLPIRFDESITGAEKRITLPTGGTLNVTIPAGVVEGQTLRLRGKGAPGAGDGKPGDALIELEVSPDPRFTREGDDLTLDLPISLAEAVLGGKVNAPTPTGDVSLTVPAGSDSNTTLRLKAKGAPRRGGGRGDQLVKLRIVLSKPADAALRDFVSNWANADSFDPREGNRS
ncbi:DnaJ C-terminal domain-containing protein [Lysobacter sp. FW306-1B-D06B]|uniref:DnaJ C-terminal domain-containing protein n=1 Tax=Lysobacter sp. FW306-1B-D06B TaxID=3140250 RepID=UPI0031400B1F